MEARVFAYNPATGEVRYAVCDVYEDAVPFWLQQDWGENLPEFAENP